MEKTTKERLEIALIDFIERATKESTSDKETEILPEMARTLITLQAHWPASPDQRW